MIKNFDLNTLLIIPADESRVEEIALIKGNKDTSVIKDRIMKSISGEVAFLIAFVEKKPIGYVLLKFNGKPTASNYPDMEDIYVIKDLRGKGIGTQLINKCEMISKEKGFNKIGMAVNPTLNLRAKLLYERLGYKAISDKQYLDGVYNGTEDWVVDLVKDLSI